MRSSNKILKNWKRKKWLCKNKSYSRILYNRLIKKMHTNSLSNKLKRNKNKKANNINYTNLIHMLIKA